MPNKKKKYSARFPPARIKKIMQKDDEVGKVAAAVPVIISRALELFVESLIKKTNNLVQSRNARTLTPQHIKQTVLVESEFKFLHELVSAIPDVQSTEDEQPSSSSSHPPATTTTTTHQAPVQEVPAAAAVKADRSPVAPSNTATSTTSNAKPGGKQRGRPRKTKTDEAKPSKAKKPKLARSAAAADPDSEETCSGSEEDHKELNSSQSKSRRCLSAGQKRAAGKTSVRPSPGGANSTEILPSSVVGFSLPVPVAAGSKDSQSLLDAFRTISSKVGETHMTLNGTATSSSSSSVVLVSGRQIAEPQQDVPSVATVAATSNNDDEALDLSTSGGKNGDPKLKRDLVGGEASLLNLQNKTLSVPRTFYMTNVQTVAAAGSGENHANKPLQLGEAYKLNIPKISIQPSPPVVRVDPAARPPGAATQGCKPSPSQPPPNYDSQQQQQQQQGTVIGQVIRPLVSSSTAIAYQIQNLAQKSQPTQIILSPMVRAEQSQRAQADGQFSPVRLLPYPRLVSLAPLAAALKSPAVSGGRVVVAAAPPSTINNDQRKVAPVAAAAAAVQPDCGGGGGAANDGVERS